MESNKFEIIFEHGSVLNTDEMNNVKGGSSPTGCIDFQTGWNSQFVFCTTLVIGKAQPE